MVLHNVEQVVPLCAQADQSFICNVPLLFPVSLPIAHSLFPQERVTLSKRMAYGLILEPRMPFQCGHSVRLQNSGRDIPVFAGSTGVP